ncbi:hypothetical protein Cni_G10570 [Canna indica]|uniref:Uncharacterized protein n=1 Tax=Canna indica TaxID=4628 RepID=A0AAQ3K6W5_9LILI|nr:hypothetical protein Cni_G10570 [Canna indica]
MRHHIIAITFWSNIGQVVMKHTYHNKASHNSNHMLCWMVLDISSSKSMLQKPICKLTFVSIEFMSLCSRSIQFHNKVSLSKKHPACLRFLTTSCTTIDILRNLIISPYLTR